MPIGGQRVNKTNGRAIECVELIKSNKLIATFMHLCEWNELYKAYKTWLVEMQFPRDALLFTLPTGIRLLRK